MAKRKKAQPKASELSRKHRHVSRRVEQQRRLLMYGAGGFVLLLALIIGWGILDQTVLKARRPVAKVNDQVITVGEFQKRVRFQRAVYVMQTENIVNNLQAMLQNPMLISYFGQQLQSWTAALNDAQGTGQKVLDEMIDEAIIVQKAHAMGITVTDEEVEKALQEAWGYFPNGTPTPQVVPTEMPTPTYSPTQLALLPPTATPTVTATGAPPTATATLAASPTPKATATATAVPPTPTPYTEEAYRQALQKYLDKMKQLAGLSEKDIRDIMRGQLYRQKVYKALTDDLPRTQEQVWARHILVKDEKTAEEVRQQLLNGGDWVALAKKYSTDPGTKDKGGDLGWFGRGQMVKPFEETAFSLKVGEISKPVQTQYGWHVIQVLGHEDRPLNNYEYQRLQQQTFQNWLAKAKAEAKIEKYDLWKQVVPDTPNLPADVAQQVQSLLSMMQQPQQQLPQPQP